MSKREKGACTGRLLCVIIMEYDILRDKNYLHLHDRMSEFDSPQTKESSNIKKLNTAGI